MNVIMRVPRSLILILEFFDRLKKCWFLPKGTLIMLMLLLKSKLINEENDSVNYSHTTERRR